MRDQHDLARIPAEDAGFVAGSFAAWYGCAPKYSDDH